MNCLEIFLMQNLKLHTENKTKDITELLTSKITWNTNPFCIPALGSLEDLTPIIMIHISVQNIVNAKQRRYTARYPTADWQSKSECSKPSLQNGTLTDKTKH